jgi:hypothetical protein
VAADGSHVGRPQPDLRRRALALAACQDEAPARLLSDAVHHRQPKPRPAPDTLGGEERLGGARQRRLVHAFARVADRDADVVARREALAVLETDGLLARGEDDGAPGRHGVACVEHEVEDGELELVWIAPRRREPEGKPRFDADARADGALQKVRHAAHQVGDVDRLDLEILAPGKGEHALRQRGSALGALHRIVEEPP